jgi:hypothetical protein
MNRPAAPNVTHHTGTNHAGSRNMIEKQHLKKCTTCGEIKPVTMFTKDKSKRDGLCSRCAACRKRYRDAHKKEEKAYNKKYRNENKDVLKENRKKYCEDHPDEVKACGKKYREEHKEQIKINKKRYNDAHKEEGKKRCKLYREAHKEEMRTYYIKYSKENVDKIKKSMWIYQHTPNGKLAMKNTNHRRRVNQNNTPLHNQPTLAQCDKIIESQNNRCALCGRIFSDELKPTMDHIVPLSKGGPHSSDNIQALCHSCNSSKWANLDYSKIQTWICVE